MNKLNEILYYVVVVSVQVLIAASAFIFKQQKRKYFWIRYGACVAVYYVLFVIVPGHFWWLNVMKHQVSNTVTINHFYTFAFALVVLILWFCFKINFQGALFYGTCGYLIQHFASSTARAIEDLIDAAIPSITGVNIRRILLLITFTGMVVAFYAFLASSMKKRNSIEVVSVSGLIVSAFAIVFVAYFRQIMEGILKELDGKTYKVMIFYNIIAVFVCALILFLLLYIYEKKDAKRENRELEMLLSVQGSMHKRTVENIELLNVKAHDLKKQIEYMRNPDNDLEKSEILDGIEEAVAKYDEIVESGCKALDYVLTEKANICSKNNIIFTYMADGNAIAQMKASDIYSLFSNALDNAIECVIKYGEEKRIISLKVMRQGKMTLIRIENYCDKEIIYEEGLPMTTKKNKSVHGFGVKSINYLVQKYKGAIKIKNEHNAFCLTIVMPAN